MLSPLGISRYLGLGLSAGGSTGTDRNLADITFELFLCRSDPMNYLI